MARVGCKSPAAEQFQANNDVQNYLVSIDNITTTAYLGSVKIAKPMLAYSLEQ